jgi:hypothetical protein
MSDQEKDLPVASRAGQYFDYADIGGADGLSACGFGRFYPDDPAGERSDFVAAMAPGKTELVAVINLGCDVPTQIRILDHAGKSIFAPDELAQAMAARAIASRRPYVPIHPRLVRTRVVFPPGVPVYVPKAWVRALRHVDASGVVMAGLIPSLLIGGETLEQAPRLHPALEASSKPAPKIGPKPRRRESES